VHILAQSTKQAQADKEALLRQMQDMQGSVEQVQLNDEQQRTQLNKYSQSNQLLQKQVQQRENEMAEVVQSLKQFAEANRQLEAQLNALRTENEQLAGGHRNPNQKI
jgi:septal ring factor EnvC (AmiA/AmiB activator)